MKKKDFLMLTGGIIALAIIVLVTVFIPKEKTQGVNVTTDNVVYKMGDPLKVKIENNSSDEVCFSSCYPYYFEKKDGEWLSYHYVSCPSENLVDNCVGPKKVKAFELTIPSLEKGFHRLAIPACLNCQLKEAFKESQWFYSNNFIVK